MKNSELLIANDQSGIYFVRIDGRADLLQAPSLRTLARTIDPQNLQTICVFLDNCTGMDSTFMGTLAMLGLKAQKCQAQVEIANASEQNKSLLINLGAERLFTFSRREIPDTDEVVWTRLKAKQESKLDTAQCVFDAHETLMDVDVKNIAKFKKVVEYTKKDLDSFRKEHDNSSGK